jgi:hypothetical protein
MSKDDASHVIGRLKIKQADRKHKQALRLKKAKQRQLAAERAYRPESTSRPGVRRGRAAIQAAAEPWTVADDPVFDLEP